MPFEIAPSQRSPTGRPKTLDPRDTSQTPPDLTRHGMSRPRSAAPRLAASRCGRPPLGAGAAALATREQRPLAEAGGRSGGAKMPLVCPIRPFLTLP